jgi:histidine triad (HIT) family protein
VDDVSDSSQCVFCDIVAGVQPSAILFEDELTMAFLDITAVTDGHTLVIPKRHARDLWAVSEEDAAAVMSTVRRMAHRIREVLNPDGLTLFQANCASGWQDVFHLHVHLVPRTDGDRLSRPWKASPVPLSRLEPARALLRIAPHGGVSKW